VIEIEAFIRRLPKAELHLHLEGTILPATLVELSARHDTQPLNLAEAEALYRFTDFTGFLDAFRAVCKQLIGPEDYELAAWRMIEHLAAQGIVHAEVLSPSASSISGAKTTPEPSSRSSRGWSGRDCAASANWEFRFTGSSMQCATSPSRRRSVSF
jgi:adenosine deaminase/aminodeoxyfutalosine deaminase